MINPANKNGHQATLEKAPPDVCIYRKIRDKIRSQFRKKVLTSGKGSVKLIGRV